MVRSHDRAINPRWGLVGLALLVAACAGPGPAPTQSQNGDASPSGAPKRITTAILGEPPLPSRQYNTGGSVPGMEALEELLNVGLAHMDDTGTLQPQLAESVPSIENGLWEVQPDGRMRLTWKLRNDAVWHDGVPFTADDVLFAARLSRDPELPIGRLAIWDSVEEIESPDPQTVVIRFNNTFFLANVLFTTTYQFRNLPMPKHLLEEPYEANKEAFLSIPFWTEEYVGTGPYTMKEWVAGSHVTLAANARYILGRPKIDEVVVKFIADSNTALANVLAGEVDLVLGRGLSLDQALTIRSNWNDGNVPLLFKSWIELFPQHVNPTPAVVSDVQFKRAMLMAIDRQQLADTIMNGEVTVADAIIGRDRPEYPAVETSIVRYAHDPRQSAQAIENLGYRKGPDNMFRDPSGQPLSVEIRTGAGLDIHEKTIFAIASSWQAVGVATEPVLVPAQQNRDREYRATYPGFSLQRQGTDLTGLLELRSSGTPTAENRYTGSNNPRYQNAEFDALLDRFAAAIPVNHRLQALGQVLNHMTDQLVVLPLFYDIEAHPLSKRMQGVREPQGDGVTQSWNAHEWAVR